MRPRVPSYAQSRINRTVFFLEGVEGLDNSAFAAFVVILVLDVIFQNDLPRELGSDC